MLHVISQDVSGYIYDIFDDGNQRENEMANGVVRIKDKHWERLTRLAVDVSVRIQRPVNQATVLHAIMHERMPLLKTAEVIEMVKSYLDIELDRV